MGNVTKILLLGGSAQQLIAIHTAQQMGYFTILCDYLPDNPGQYVADRYYSVSTTDVEAVYDIAKKENVNGILAYASDPAALPAAIVAEKLGLPTNPSKLVSILGVKHEFRAFLQKHNFVCPQYYVFPSETDEKVLKEKINAFKFPIMIKPTDSSGSKGVTKLESIKDLPRALEWATEYSRNKILIAEEFIDRGFPDVIGGDIFVWNGEIILFGEMACLRDSKRDGLIPIGKKKPSGLNQYQTELVRRELQRIIDLLDYRFGELNIELLLDKENNVHFLELGPRAGGNMIPIQLSDAFGVDLVKANILVSMGINPNLSLQEQKGCFMHYVLHSYQEGIFEGVEYADIVKPFIYREVIYKKPGDNVECFDGAGKALGIIFLNFDTVQQMDDFCENHDSYIGIVMRCDK